MNKTALLSVVVVVSLSFLPGCWMGDGRYVIRGKVFGKSDQALKPVPGATVVVGDPKVATRRAETPSDGTYVVTYAVGGMAPFINSGNPTLSFSAPGFAPVSVPLMSSGETPGVTRGECQPRQPDCFVLDIVLSPLAVPQQTPAAPAAPAAQ